MRNKKRNRLPTRIRAAFERDRRFPDGRPNALDRAAGRLALWLRNAQVDKVVADRITGESCGAVPQSDPGSCADVRALRANSSSRLKLKPEELLALIPKYAGCGQGSPRSVIQHIFLGEGVRSWYGGVVSTDNIDNIRLLLEELGQGNLKAYNQASKRIHNAPVEEIDAYYYDDFSEGMYIIRDRGFAYVSQIAPKMWACGFDLIGEDLSDEEVKAFNAYRVREEAKRDLTKYQHIWMLVDYGNNDLNFHDKKVPLSEFKSENYSQANREWLYRLRDTLFKPNATGRLTVFQGAAGTGKTRYLRALMQELGETVCPVVLPVSLASDLSNPRMLGVLTGNSAFEKKHVLLIIEDGDGLLEKREHSSSVISDFLNVVDGLIGEVVNLHIVVTTNLQKKDFDPAITRPGRLHSILYFEALEYAQAATVYKRETGVDLEKTQDTYTLAEIYGLVQEHSNGLRKKVAPATGQGQYL